MTDELLELEISALSSEGDGVARTPGGRVVFVPFTAPGDRVQVRVVARKPRFLRGRVEVLRAPGAARVDPVCPVYGSCGGCSWQHVAYPAQLEQKRLQVRAAFERIARLDPPPVEMTASRTPYRYRVRTRVLREGTQVGYRRRRSRALCPVTRCPILSDSLEIALRELARDDGAAAGEWELSQGQGAVRRVHARDASGAAGAIELEVGGDRLEISPGVFFQANGGLHEALLTAVLEAAGRGPSALELYAGAGFFTLGLARRFERVLAVESQGPAVQDCRRNLARAGLPNATVLEMPLERAIDSEPVASVRPSAIVLDPPRAGVAEAARSWLGERGADRIVYLSCDPATLARDVASLGASGYRLRSLRAFDLFPQTPHVEVLAVLESDRWERSR